MPAPSESSQESRALGPGLRGYQREVFDAVVRRGGFAWRKQADTVVVKMPRQSGKNEVSAHIERAMLVVHAGASVSGVKAAPTADPQVRRSIDRLASKLRGSSIARAVGFAAGDQTVRLGQASWWFGSGEPDANVVGATASILLEIDEAQDFDVEKFDKDYAPMAASTAAARVFYGTPWSDYDLLARMSELAKRQEGADGRRRYFEVSWERVAEEVPAYAVHVEAERERLGHSTATPHPAFVTQYLLGTLGQSGRMLNERQLEMLQGEHPRLSEPQAASRNVYVAGLDVGGANISGAESPDETVLTMARTRYAGRGLRGDPMVDIVGQWAWAGLDHDAQRGEILRLLQLWGVTHVAVDATGIGEPMATYLARELGERKVTMLKFSRSLKSELGWDLIAAVNVGGLRVWKPEPGDADHAALMWQARMAVAEYAGAGQMLWAVDSRVGHDDRLVSLALAVRAAQRGQPRIARGR